MLVSSAYFSPLLVMTLLLHATLIIHVQNIYDKTTLNETVGHSNVCLLWDFLIYMKIERPTQNETAGHSNVSGYFEIV